MVKNKQYELLYLTNCVYFRGFVSLVAIMTEMDMPLNFSMKKLDSTDKVEKLDSTDKMDKLESTDKVDENMNTLPSNKGLHIFADYSRVLSYPPPPKL